MIYMCTGMCERKILYSNLPIRKNVRKNYHFGPWWRLYLWQFDYYRYLVFVIVLLSFDSVGSLIPCHTSSQGYNTDWVNSVVYKGHAPACSHCLCHFRLVITSHQRLRYRYRKNTCRSTVLDIRITGYHEIPVALSVVVLPASLKPPDIGKALGILVAVLDLVLQATSIVL